MNRMAMFCGLGILGLAMIVSTGATQDAKKDKDAKKEAGKVKGQLPAGFKDLGLSAEQIQKIYAIQADYNAKIAELNKQIAELKGKKSKEEFGVLTKDQLEKYLKAKGLEGKDKATTKDKDAKDKDKKTEDKK